MRCQDYKYTELAVIPQVGKRIRNWVVDREDGSRLEDFRQQYHNTDIFAGIQRHIHPDLESESIVPIFFDIDNSEDLEAARESALALCLMLLDRISVPQESLDIYFSGHKGFHILVPCEVFEAFYSPHVFALYKRMALKAVQQGIRFIDTSVYTHRRIWRLPNSINSKSGRFKIPLTFEEIRDMDITGIRRLAQLPRPQESFAEVKPCENTSQWFRNAIQYFETRPVHADKDVKNGNEKFRYGWRMVPCVKSIEQATVPDGMRHELYLNLSQYYAFLNMHFDEIMERIVKIDQRNPIRDSDSLKRMIEWGYKHRGFAGCDHRVFKSYCNKENCFYAQLKIHTNLNKKQET